MDIFGSIWNWLCDMVSSILDWIVDFLPDSPFKMLDNTPIKPYLKYINWVIPVDFILTTISLWLIAVAGYYTYSFLLRLIKAVD